MFEKNFKSTFKEDTNQFFMLEKNVDLHLRKIQIRFYVRRKFRSDSKEDTDLFCVLKISNLHLRIITGNRDSYGMIITGNKNITKQL